MAVVLLYNLAGTEKGKTIRLLARRLGVETREVSWEDYAQPIGYLAGLPGYARNPLPAAGEVPEEMLVLCGLSHTQFSELLDALRRNGAAVALKAVLTQHNAAWPSSRLFQELKREQAALGRAHKPGK